jgi:hypothetical protein
MVFPIAARLRHDPSGHSRKSIDLYFPRGLCARGPARPAVVAGQDSNVMVWLARKAFFGHVPFPVLHVDTGKKFDEMYAFRDRYAAEWGLELIVRDCPPVEEMDPSLPPAARSAARKTAGLNALIGERGLKGVIAGIRRDEEGTRAKERVSARAATAMSGISGTSLLNSGTSIAPTFPKAAISASIRCSTGPSSTFGATSSARTFRWSISTSRRTASVTARSATAISRSPSTATRRRSTR